jgi:glutamyl-Q tRNA(Asp) synthetase
MSEITGPINKGKPAVTRFAPSPTGYLHLGHAYSALFAAEQANAQGGRFILRIEDIDGTRCRPEFEDAIFEDLEWLGLAWELPVRRQSDHMDDYAEVLEKLTSMGLLYPCFCTRKDIQREIAGAANAPHGPDGPVYPGTCRSLSQTERIQRIESGEAHALRLDMAAATKRAGSLSWHDRIKGRITATPEVFGDVVLARKDTPTSYHLAVTLDDHLQGISLVTRGTDLFEATHVHRLLQSLLGWSEPSYHHHPLLIGTDGKRYAKRDKSLTIRALREAGKSAEQVRRMATPEGSGATDR